MCPTVYECQSAPYQWNNISYNANQKSLQFETLLLEDKFGFEFKEMSKMTEEIFAHMLGNIGVPAALCFYTLFQVNRTMEKLIQSIDKLETRIDRLEDRIFSLYGSKE